MFSRFPSDKGYSDEDNHQTADTDAAANGEFDNVVAFDRSQLKSATTPDLETTELDPDWDSSQSVMQLAFIRLMTQKVIEATANCPDVMKHMNSSIRRDQD